MSSNVVNQVAYLRTSREFPEDLRQLTIQLSKSYIDVANAVNQRTIGIFPTNRPAICGESWFINSNQRQQTLRQVYTFGAIAAGANLQITYTTEGLNQFTRIYGTCITAQPDFRPIPFASVTANANIEVRITPNPGGFIIISNGAGGPNIVSGLLIIEYLSAV